MAFEPHARMTFSGVLGTLALPYERWSVRLNLSNGGTPSTPTLAMATEGAAAWATHMLNTHGSWCRLTEVKLANIGADGLYTGSPVIAAVDHAGTSGAAPNPPQIAMAVSLGTTLRGPRGRGRFYIPAPAAAVEVNTGLIPTANQTFVQGKVVAFLNALNAISQQGNVVIASSFGFSTPVTTVRVGRALDTIRSRRTSVVEGYSTPTAVTLGPV
jgi:hypothetical protein